MHVCKKQKVIKTTNTVKLDKEDIGLIADVVVEVAKSSFEGLRSQQKQVANKVTEHLYK